MPPMTGLIWRATSRKGTSMADTSTIRDSVASTMNRIAIPSSDPPSIPDLRITFASFSPLPIDARGYGGQYAVGDVDKYGGPPERCCFGNLQITNLCAGVCDSPKVRADGADRYGERGDYDERREKAECVERRIEAEDNGSYCQYGDDDPPDHQVDPEILVQRRPASGYHNRQYAKQEEYEYPVKDGSYLRAAQVSEYFFVRIRVQLVAEFHKHRPIPGK